jgi:hypothetical protein
MGEGYISQVLQDGERRIRLKEVSDRGYRGQHWCVEFPLLIKTWGDACAWEQVALMVHSAHDRVLKRKLPHLKHKHPPIHTSLI